MKFKMFLAILVGLCFTFISTVHAYAQTEDILKKQKEIDDYVFVQHQDELTEKGITVTHTAPLEDTVEIGIIPYNEENISYLYDIFGEEQVTIVEGQQAELMNQTTLQGEPSVSETSNDNTFSMTSLFIIAGSILLLGSYLLLKKKKA
ncbi:hypothetical protein [Bacillus sp. MRMR6]|uniref:hypothetical protein n=1 Tax=Bacillus sp. MRMR6 TaxID=1928617 RepID=UPI0009511E29|nr:hypothetical protein [Bacillus sp. MRMR6]OLS41005.1 hypothetical protein BTR25_06685 [Bacillus sp. MRMR6]